MPIIINGASRRCGNWWAKHLTNKETNERVELVEMRGLAAETVSDAFREMQALAIGTRCDNYFYQANINPRADEHLTPAQWAEAVDTLERNLGLEGQPRFVIEHEKGGRVHRHVVWSRIDVEHQRAISDSLTAPIHERTSRQLEIRFDLERGKSILVPDRDFERPERGPAKWELFRGERHGLDARQITAEMSELWRATDSGQSFKAAIEERGYVLAQGDRRDFVILDPAGDVHSLARRLEGVRVKDVGERLADLDPSTLPSVAKATALIDARRHGHEHHDRDASDAAWQAAVIDAAVAGVAPDIQRDRRAPTADRPMTAVEARIADLAATAPNGAAFVTEIQKAGLYLARATAEDIAALSKEFTANFAAYQAPLAELTKITGPRQETAVTFTTSDHANDPPLPDSVLNIREGELVAVNGFGGLHRLDPLKVDGALCEALWIDGADAKFGGLDSIAAVRGDLLDVRADRAELWRQDRVEQFERATEANDAAGWHVPAPKALGNAARGVGKLLDLLAKPVEQFIGYLDSIIAPSQPETLMTPPNQPEPDVHPGEYPSPLVPMPDDVRRRAVARALGEIDSTRRQDRERREREQGRENTRERERERDLKGF